MFKPLKSQYMIKAEKTKVIKFDDEFKEGDMVVVESVDFNNWKEKITGEIGAIEPFASGRFDFHQNEYSGSCINLDKLVKSNFKDSWILRKSSINIYYRIKKISIKDKVDLINFQCLNH